MDEIRELEEQELKSCPGCGGKGVWLQNLEPQGIFYVYYQCRECGWASMRGAENEEKARLYWNTRRNTRAELEVKRLTARFELAKKALEKLAYRERYKTTLTVTGGMTHNILIEFLSGESAETLYKPWTYAAHILEELNES